MTQSKLFVLLDLKTFFSRVHLVEWEIHAFINAIVIVFVERRTSLVVFGTIMVQHEVCFASHFHAALEKPSNACTSP